MINLISIKVKHLEWILLSTFSIICIFLSILRVVYSGELNYIFLNWNLFLASIPWLISNISTAFPNWFKSKYKAFLLLGPWILFFPNAPYILTDLYHLQYNEIVPFWYDLILILSFAWTGLLFGFLSLLDMETILAMRLKQGWLNFIMILLLFVTGFGIYLGRFLRLNSWDVFCDPWNIVFEIGSRFLYPFDHPRTWGVTLFMGLFLNMVFWSLRFFKKLDF